MAARSTTPSLPLLIPNPKAFTHFTFQRRIVGWVDSDTADKGAVDCAQSHHLQWCWWVPQLWLSPGLSQDVCKRTKPARLTTRQTLHANPSVTDFVLYAMLFYYQFHSGISKCEKLCIIWRALLLVTLESFVNIFLGRLKVELLITQKKTKKVCYYLGCFPFHFVNILCPGPKFKISLTSRLLYS